MLSSLLNMTPHVVNVLNVVAHVINVLSMVIDVVFTVLRVVAFRHFTVFCLVGIIISVVSHC